MGGVDTDHPGEGLSSKSAFGRTRAYLGAAIYQWHFCGESSQENAARLAARTLPCAGCSQRPAMSHCSV
jgi:hypothetical protein